jgi:hypothetical protein
MDAQIYAFECTARRGRGTTGGVLKYIEDVPLASNAAVRQKATEFMALPENLLLVRKFGGP